MSITNVPSAVFLDHIVPHLEVKEIGSLSMVSKDLKEFCDDNLVWREMYLRTIRCVVVDRSIHLRLLQPLQHDMLYHNTIIGPDGHLFQNSSWCIPTEVRLSVPTIPPALVNFRHGYNHSPERKVKMEHRAEYSEVIRRTWQAHNKEHGLSTVNLCQCAGHYQFNTLAVPASCKNSKSYKTTVLSKMWTQAKIPLTSLNAKIPRHQAEIQRLHVLLRSRSEFAYTERIREYLKCFIAKEANLKASHATKSHIYNNLDTAVTSMKVATAKQNQQVKDDRKRKKDK